MLKANRKKKTKDRAALLVATLGGAGYSPIAPGTIGSLAALILWVPLIFLETPLIVRVAVLALACAAAIWSTKIALAYFGKDDPAEVVIDELAGVGVALLLAGPSWPQIALAFVLFRGFDILKPWPISYFDQTVKGAFGVLLDDLLAGVGALILLQVAKALI